MAGSVVKPMKDGGGNPFNGQLYDDGSGNLVPLHHVLDGADETQGAKADPAASDSTSAWSINALLKGAWAKLEAIRALLAGTLTTKGSPVTHAAVLTPGTPVPAGRKVVIVCTAVGTVRLKFADTSTLDVHVEVGTSEFDGYAAVDVVAANTTATATVTVLS